MTSKRNKGHGINCRCVECLKYVEYARLWQARMMRAYAFALAHERAVHAWRRAGASRARAWARARAEVWLIYHPGEDASKSRQEAQERAFNSPVVCWDVLQDTAESKRFP